MRKLLMALAALLPLVAHAVPFGQGAAVLRVAAVTVTPAGTVLTLSWVNPTSYTDNTPLPVTDITQTRLEYGSCTGSGATLAFGTKAAEFIALGGKTQQASPALQPGTYCFRAYTTAKGTESIPSNPTQVIVAQPAPLPPTNLSGALATTGTTAFTILKQRDAQTVLAVGSVPLGTPCIVDEGLIAHGVLYTAVPVASIAWAGTVRSSIVYAACG